MKTENEIKELLSNLGIMKLDGITSNGKKWKGTAGVYVYAGRETTQGRSGTQRHADDDKRIILRISFSFWHSGQQKYVKGSQWNTRTTQACLTESRLQGFAATCRETGNKRADKFSEERHDAIMKDWRDYRAMMREYHATQR